MTTESIKSRPPPEADNPNLTFNPQINEHSRRLASARRSSSRISELFTDPVSPRCKSQCDGAVVPQATDESPDDADDPVEDETTCVADIVAGSPSRPVSPSKGMPSPPRKRTTNVEGNTKLPPVQPPIKYSFDSQLTFSPQLNKNSIRILAETGKCRVSVLERLTARRDPEQNASSQKQFTFMPEVSKRSMQMMENLSTSFLSRQQETLERRKKAMSPEKFACYYSMGQRSVETTPVKKRTVQMPLSDKPSSKALQKCTPMAAAAANGMLGMSAARKLSFSRHYKPTDFSKSPQSGEKPKIAMRLILTSPSQTANKVLKSESSPKAKRSLKFEDPSDDEQLNSQRRQPSSEGKSKSTDGKKVASQISSPRKLSLPKSTPGLAWKSRQAAKPTAKQTDDEEPTPLEDAAEMQPLRSQAEGKSETVADVICESEDSDSGDDEQGANPGKPARRRKRKTSLPKHMDINRVRRVKDKAAEAIKQKKIFSIYGPYPMVRHVLRKRGWVEFEYNVKKGIAAKKAKKTKKKAASTSPNGKAAQTEQTAKRDPSIGMSDSDDDDDNDDDDNNDANADDNDEPPRFAGYEPMTPTEQEEWGMLSRAVRYAHPHLIWSMMKDDIEFKFLEKDQYVNHFREGHAFTTKVGICKNLRQLSWFRQQDPDDFFPRCYILSSEEERDEFVDNYRLTAAMAILKSYCSGANKPDQASNGGVLETPKKSACASGEEQPVRVEGSLQDGDSTTDTCSSSDTSPATARRGSKPKQPRRKGRSKSLNKSSSNSSSTTSLDGGLSTSSLTGQPGKRRRQSRPFSSIQPVLTAYQVCETYLREKEHEFLDQEDQREVLTDEQWSNLIAQFYLICHERAIIEYAADDVEEKGLQLLERLKEVVPQYELDGTRNVWIVKPGAKSRGRGIFCVDRLDKILTLVEGISTLKESKWVVQKYIERPLLIHGTKFDIRQWFLVTDWNPLTLWFYKSSYLRFCGQHFTLKNLSPSIHLANNAIQRYLEVASCRSSELPDDNMWSSDRFQEYLKDIGEGERWITIYEGMKDATIGTLLSMQDIIDCRKHSFELFGADFMLTADFKPWLIEINCSPALSASTKVTGRLCAAVIEDTMKVVIDRRNNKKADTGDFEMAFKRPHISMPSYVGAQLGVCGQQIKKPH